MRRSVSTSVVNAEKKFVAHADVDVAVAVAADADVDADADADADPEVVIAGAGPAGSAAALVLARAGRRVLLLDAKTFPRDKVCGDLVGTEAVAILKRLGVCESALVGALRLGGAVLYGPHGRCAGTRAGAERASRATDARVIARETFDARLLAAAREAGASFAPLRVFGLRRDARGDVTGVRTNAGDVRARVTIAADGWGSAVARDLGVMPSVASGDVAIVARAYVRGVAGLGRRMHFFVNRPGDGYAWLFPLGDGSANAGLGFIRGEPGEGDVRAAFARFLGPNSSAARFLASAEAGAVATWPIPLGPQRLTVATRGALVAGDAAALASPLSGSGIHNALASGAAAARFALAALCGRNDGPARYAAWIRTYVARRLAVERFMHRVAATPERIEPWLAVARALPGAEDVLARALLALG